MYIGIDVGGTNLVAGIVTADGVLLKKAQRKCGSERGAEAVMADILGVAVDVCQKAGISAGEIEQIGLGIPGAVDDKNGKVIFSPNIPLSGVALSEIVRSRWGDTAHGGQGRDVAVHLINDADAAAFGEFSAGSAKGYRNMMLITLGTGLGGGIVIDGKVFSGANNIGAEIGHLVIEHGGRPCNCGRLGCCEKYAAASGLISLAQEQMARDKNSALWRLAPNPADVEGQMVFMAAAEGDKSAQDVIALYIDYLANGISSIINIFQPEVICLGGGVSNAGDALLMPLREIVAKDTFRHPEKNTEIRIASLGNDAGIIGAALAKT